MEELKGAGCDHITIGQYLKPAPGCLDVGEFIDPERFVYYARLAEKIGFKGCSSSPFTRSSFEPGLS